jgi:hypothetical protein
VIGDYFEQISVIFPEGGLAALTRLRSYVQERMGQLSRMGGAVAATHIAEGRPYQEIVKLADTLQADLIVIGTAVHGSLFGSSQVLGSEIERVIRNAPCPVLCVPAARVVTPLRGSCNADCAANLRSAFLCCSISYRSACVPAATN